MATGEIRAPAVVDVADAARLAALQHALGDTCGVRRLLGRGGFAEVYVAYDKRLKREIAVKTIRGDLVVNEMLLERFQREAEAVAKLRHPNVIPIYSVGESGGLVYFTMPLIEGDSLATVIERDGRLSVLESVRILREAALALNAAHRAGIVHRDVKPENIMLEGPERSVVVMDFGIAKSTEAEAHGLTGTGMIVGTLHYMSPEQAMGEKTLDARSDQYALATVGYRMLTGRAPFEGSAQTLIFKTVTEVPTPICEVAPDLPVALSDVLAKAMSKRREDRYESMAEFVAALAPLENRAAGSVAPTGRARVDFATRRREMAAALPRLRAPLIAGAGALVATVALLAVATPRVPITVASGREEALFAAKMFLSKHAGPARRDEFTTFAHGDTTVRFLQRAIGFEGMQARASTDVPVWEWGVHFISTDPKSDWRVWIGWKNRVTGFKRQVADSAPGARLSVDSARVLAEAALSDVGWVPAQLERQPDSTIARKARTDHLFRWRPRTGAIQWHEKDSAYVRLLVAVAGDSVVQFTEKLQTPESYSDDRNRAFVGGVVALIMLLACVVTIVVLIQRQRVDDFQWRSVTRLIVFVCATFFVSGSPEMNEFVTTWRAGGVSEGTSPLAGMIGLLFLACVMLCVGVAGESLMSETKPSVLAGFADASRGRLLIPDIVSAAAFGYGGGAVMSLLSALSVFASLTFGIGRPALPDLPFSRVPMLEVPLNAAGQAVGGTLLLLLLTAFAYRIPRLKGFALFVPAIAAALFLSSTSGRSAAIVTGFFTVLLLTWVLWQHGVLAAFIAMAASELILDVPPLLRADDVRYVSAGVVAIAILCLPGVLAAIAYRRWRPDAGNVSMARS